MADQESLGGEYILHEEIGRGPLAVVRRATSRFGGPPLAAKLLRPEFADDRRVRDLFLREEPALRDLVHPSIVAVRDLVVERGRIALLTDYVDGVDLRRYLRNCGGLISAAEAAAITAQIAAALAVAHARGAVHLDIKPENILLVRGADPPLVRVCDFGVAVLLHQAGHAVIGATPGYSAPEVLRGGPVTAAADVYSIGAVLVELVEGALPVPGDAGTRLPDPLNVLARECLATDPSRRSSARSVAVRLRAVGRGQAVGEAAATTFDPPASPPIRWRRGPLLTLAAAIIVAAVLVGANVMAAASRALPPRNTTVVVSTLEPTPESPGPAIVLPPTEAVEATAPADRTRATFAGRVTGDAGTLAISVRDGVAIAYVCDGKKLEAWLRGTALGGRLKLSGKNGAGVTATFDAAGAHGTLTVAGRTHPFSIGSAKKPSGLYRTAAKVRNAKVVGSWIVLPDGRQVGVLTQDGRTGPAPTLDVARRTTTVLGTAVTTSTIDVDTGEGF